jgi:hypothetical protein
MEFEVVAGAEIHVPQKTIAEGTMVLTGHISRIEVIENGAPVVAASAPFNVGSPTKDYRITLAESETGLHINH